MKKSNVKFLILLSSIAVLSAGLFFASGADAQNIKLCVYNAVTGQGTCESKPGIGPNLCETDGDCEGSGGLSYNACVQVESGFVCSTFAGPGFTSCIDNLNCGPNATHPACVDNICEIVPGPPPAGEPLCNIEDPEACLESHTICNFFAEKCEGKDGAGEDECTEDEQCVPQGWGAFCNNLLRCQASNNPFDYCDPLICAAGGGGGGGYGTRCNLDTLQCLPAGQFDFCDPESCASGGGGGGGFDYSCENLKCVPEPGGYCDPNTCAAGGGGGGGFDYSCDPDSLTCVERPGGYCNPEMCANGQGGGGQPGAICFGGECCANDGSCGIIEFAAECDPDACTGGEETVCQDGRCTYSGDPEDYCDPNECSSIGGNGSACIDHKCTYTGNPTDNCDQTACEGGEYAICEEGKCVDTDNPDDFCDPDECSEGEQSICEEGKCVYTGNDNDFCDPEECAGQGGGGEEDDLFCGIDEETGYEQCLPCTDEQIADGTCPGCDPEQCGADGDGGGDGDGDGETKCHLACENERCVAVEGEGENTCSFDSQCGGATHTVCNEQNSVCEELEGPGINQCRLGSDGDCYKLGAACVAGKCVPGSVTGLDQCEADDECAPPKCHKGCVDQKCTVTEGEGADACTTDAQCGGGGGGGGAPAKYTYCSQNEDGEPVCLDKNCPEGETCEDQCEADDDCVEGTLKIIKLTKVESQIFCPPIQEGDPIGFCDDAFWFGIQPTTNWRYVFTDNGEGIAEVNLPVSDGSYGGDDCISDADCDADQVCSRNKCRGGYDIKEYFEGDQNNISWEPGPNLASCIVEGAGCGELTCTDGTGSCSSNKDCKDGGACQGKCNNGDVCYKDTDCPAYEETGEDADTSSIDYVSIFANKVTTCTFENIPQGLLEIEKRTEGIDDEFLYTIVPELKDRQIKQALIETQENEGFHSEKLEVGYYSIVEEAASTWRAQDIYCVDQDGNDVGEAGIGQTGKTCEINSDCSLTEFCDQNQCKYYDGTIVGIPIYFGQATMCQFRNAQTPGILEIVKEARGEDIRSYIYTDNEGNIRSKLFFNYTIDAASVSENVEINQINPENPSEGGLGATEIELIPGENYTITESEASIDAAKWLPRDWEYGGGVYCQDASGQEIGFPFPSGTGVEEVVVQSGERIRCTFYNEYLEQGGIRGGGGGEIQDERPSIIENNL